MKTRKVFKWMLVFTIVMLSMIAIAAALLVNVVFTPKKLTPIVVKAVNRQLAGELTAETISLTFFSTFPDVSLKIGNATIFTRSTADSTSNEPKRDTLASFETAFVSFDAIAFWSEQKLKVHKLEIIHPIINASISPEGIANWNIVKEATAESMPDQQDTVDVSLDLSVKDLILDDASISYHDHGAALTFLVSELDVKMRIAANKDGMVLNTSFYTSNINIKQGNKIYASGLKLGASTHAILDKTSDVLSIEEGTATVNDVDFAIAGKLGPSSKTSVPVDLSLSLIAPSLEKLVHLVPQAVSHHAKDFKTSGKVLFSATLKGNYGRKEIPTVFAKLLIKNGSIQYRERPTKIDKINTDLEAHVDFTKKTPSKFTIKQFMVHGHGVSMAVDGVVNDLLGNAQITGNASGQIDLALLQNSLPFSTEIATKGNIDMSLMVKVAYRDIIQQDYGKFNLRGKVSFLNTKISYRNDSIQFSVPRMQMNFGATTSSTRPTTHQTSLLGGVITASRLKTSIKNAGSLSSDSLFIGFGTTPWSDTSKLANITSTVKIRNADISLGDTAKAVAGKLNARVRLGSSARSANRTLETEFFIDSALFRSKELFLRIQNGDYAFKISKDADNTFPANGHISFDQVLLYSKSFPTLISIPKTKIVVRPGLIELQKAVFEIGKSDIELTGQLYNFGHVLLKRKPLKGTLRLNATMVDVNELVSILNKAAPQDPTDSNILNEQNTQRSHASTPEPTLKTFVVPKGIDFTFESNIRKLLYAHLEITDVHGEIKVNDQNLRLSKFRMKTMGADIHTTLRYVALDSASASVNFNLGLYDVEMNNLSKIIPSLDTLLPMARSFEGNVDFVLNGTSKLNAKMELDLGTLRAIARVKGQNLVVMDSETFSQVSKTLMFKNKDRNVVDSASFEILIANSTMEVLPSILSIDRYRIAVGGFHKIDMTYDYHVSVLKSPMPFKAGLDLLGDLNDYKIKVTNAKYKYLFSDKKRHEDKVDSTIIRKKHAILKRITF